MEIDLEQLRALMRSLSEFDVSEVEIESGDERIVVRRGGVAHTAVVTAAAPAPVGPPSVAPPPIAAAPAPASPVEDDDNVVSVTSPFVGTFYRSPAPDADPFVEKGSRIKPGQVLCIVEAMKLMNEIESEISGTIVEILVDNGKPVEYGDPLFKVQKG